MLTWLSCRYGKLKQSIKNISISSLKSGISFKQFYGKRKIERIKKTFENYINDVSLENGRWTQQEKKKRINNKFLFYDLLITTIFKFGILLKPKKIVIRIYEINYSIYYVGNFRTISSSPLKQYSVIKGADFENFIKPNAKRQKHVQHVTR